MEDPKTMDPDLRAELGIDENGMMLPSRAIDEPERPPCKHDSTRLDCWLDTHCLRCGTPGYWIDGELIAKNPEDAIAKLHLTRGHPGGKMLISQGPGTE